jgi:hypothetical protein
MLIRQPVAMVFEAFVDPAITSKFCLARVVAGWRRRFGALGLADVWVSVATKVPLDRPLTIERARHPEKY